MCLKSMIDKNDLGNICHEHLEFYTYKSLKYLFEKNGFYIFKIEENNVNGGSFRIFCLKGNKRSVTFQENTSLKYIKNFIGNVERNKKLFLDFLHRELKNNKIFHVYGASTKGNTVLQYFKLDSSKISHASDRSPEKWGKYTIGSGIKIISEKDSRKMNPNYYVVFPYGFMDEFKKREKKWLKKGGKFVVLYPKFNIIS
jgi:NDP-4-keto-2,6-dideoxyhexose 3-C-methyltransferase